MSNQVGVCQGRSQLAWKSLSNEEKTRILSLKGSSERTRVRGVQHQTDQSKHHPTQGLLNAIPKLAVAMPPADWKSSDCLCRTLSHSPWALCCWPMSVTINSLHDCTSQTPCPFWGWGGEKEEKEKSNRRKKVTRESKLLLADPNTLSGRQEVKSRHSKHVLPKISLVGEESPLPPPRHCVRSTHLQSEMRTNKNGLKNLGHKGLEEKA